MYRFFPTRDEGKTGWFTDEPCIDIDHVAGHRATLLNGFSQCAILDDGDLFDKQYQKRKPMKTLILRFSIIVVAFVLGLSFVWAQQVNRQQQIQQQQMQTMLNHMDQLMNRTRSMNNDINQRLQQAQTEQIRSQYRLVSRFGEQMGRTLTEMKEVAQTCNEMSQHQELNRNQEMQDEMNRLRLHLNNMTNQMDEAVSTLDRIRQRIRDQEMQVGEQ